ncbi:hypothetical protein [Streptomyces griseiscabiei]|uniref:Uncharacterized protein n=2 Tax=Streptomyces TaxID=1883 RepID=A0ABU4LIY6_9ACTN|nr:hypothetical protein [Streptomyces griseiscabiei]MBZ3908250.1 hypothetical protein [Streptomyces griseiscabiei]MDX2915662.1 hypothetical protein [Streptomyces griseiscabiei]
MCSTLLCSGRPRCRAAADREELLRIGFAARSTEQRSATPPGLLLGGPYLALPGLLLGGPYLALPLLLPF